MGLVNAFLINLCLHAVRNVSSCTAGDLLNIASHAFNLFIRKKIISKIKERLRLIGQWRLNCESVL